MKKYLFVFLVLIATPFISRAETIMQTDTAGNYDGVAIYANQMSGEKITTTGSVDAVITSVQARFAKSLYADAPPAGSVAQAKICPLDVNDLPDMANPNCYTSPDSLDVSGITTDAWFTFNFPAGSYITNNTTAMVIWCTNCTNARPLWWHLGNTSAQTRYGYDGSTWTKYTSGTWQYPIGVYGTLLNDGSMVYPNLPTASSSMNDLTSRFQGWLYRTDTYNQLVFNFINTDTFVETTYRVALQSAEGWEEYDYQQIIKLDVGSYTYTAYLHDTTGTLSDTASSASVAFTYTQAESMPIMNWNIDCSAGGWLEEGICEILVYLFVPSNNAMQSLVGLKDLSNTKLPFSYFFSIQDAWTSANAQSGTAPSNFSITISPFGSITIIDWSHIDDAFATGLWDTLMNLITWGIYIGFGFWVYRFLINKV